MRAAKQKKQRLPLVGGTTAVSAASSSKTTTTAVEADVRLSKALSKVLRHQALEVGLVVAADGFVGLEEVLKLPGFVGFTKADVERVVQGNDKQRFALRENPSTGKVEIRANQGHTIVAVRSEELLERIEIGGKAEKQPPLVAIHGTHHHCWESIKKKGLCKMKRNHIHFAGGEVGAREVISGMRASCELLIYLNVNKVLEDGIPLYRSGNGVILCEGIGPEGVLPVKYFSKVVEKQTGKIVFEPVQEVEERKVATSTTATTTTTATVTATETVVVEEKEDDDEACAEEANVEDDDDWEIVKLSEEELKASS